MGGPPLQRWGTRIQLRNSRPPRLKPWATQLFYPCVTEPKSVVRGNEPKKRSQSDAPSEMPPMKNVLVTGGAGFIGSHLVGRLVERGVAVRVLDNLSTGKRENLSAWLDRIELLEGDLRRPEDCAAACRDIEVVFHEGAIPSVPTSVEDPIATHEANVNGTFNILMAARDARCRRLVFAASSAAYGNDAALPACPSARPAPLSPYAVHKVTGEYYCAAFTACYGLDTVSLRYFNVFGPRQDPKSQYAAAIPAFVTALLRNEPPTVYGDGEQSRDFCYIDNVVDANILAGEAKVCGGAVVNVACGERVTVNHVIARANELLGTSIAPVYEPDRPGDVRHSWADIRRTRELIGYEPQVLFDEGLQRAIDWYTANLG